MDFRFGLAFLVLMIAGCGGGRPGISSRGEVLPDLPRASIGLDLGSEVVFHGRRYRLVEVTEEEVGRTAVQYAAGPADSRSEALGRTLEGQWALEGETLLRFSAVTAQGDRALLSLYDLPSLRKASRQIDPFEGLDLKEGEHLFFDEGFIALDRVRGNDPGRTDDERAEVTVLLDGKLSDVAVAEYGSVRTDAGQIVVADDIYPGRFPGGGSARIRIIDEETRTGVAVEAREIEIPDGMAHEEADLMIRAGVLPGRDGLLRALVSLRSDLLRRDVLMEEGESLRCGLHEAVVEQIGETAVSLRVLTLESSAYPVNVRFPGDRQMNEPQKTPEPPGTTSSRISRTLRLSDRLEIQGATIELVGLVENNRTSLSDDAAELQVSHGDKIDRVVGRKGERHTVYGDNRWWVIQLDSVLTGQNGEVKLAVETGPFMGAQSSGESATVR